jgi:hypothetical protein
LATGCPEAGRRARAQAYRFSPKLRIYESKTLNKERSLGRGWHGGRNQRIKNGSGSLDFFAISIAIHRWSESVRKLGLRNFG